MVTMSSSEVALHNLKHAPKVKAPPEADKRAEKVLQNEMVRLLDQRGIFHSRARTDKSTTTRVGLFDFTIYLRGGRYMAVEAKVKGGRLSDSQTALFEEFHQKTGERVKIIWSLQEFKQLLDESPV